MSAPEIQKLVDAGLQSLQNRQLARAEEQLAEALRLAPNHPQALHLLGITIIQARHDPRAIDLLRRAITIAADNPDFHMNLGNVLRQQGRVGESIESYREALRLRPDHVLAMINLATAMRDSGRAAEAVELYHSALRMQPNLAQTHALLGNALRDLGQIDEAIAAHRRAIAFDPHFVGGHLNLGAALHDLGKLEDAIAAYQAGLAVDPNAAGLYINLTGVLREAGRLDEAVAAGKRAIQLAPNSAEAHNNLGTALMHQGFIEDAVLEYREALRLNPSFVPARDNLLFALNYRTTWDAQTILREHRQYEVQHVAPFFANAAPPPRDPVASRRIRVGYVSGDLRDHPVGRFMHPIFAHHDRSQFEILAYHNLPGRDAFSEKLRQRVDHWHDVGTLGGTQLDALVRQHRIDILIDLSGHTAGNRLLVFARKPAPIQVTYLGYPTTTGLRAMDYRITDDIADPAGADVNYVEKLVRLPGCFLCYQGPSDAPDIAALPALAAGTVTFGSFNNFAKVSPETMRLWAEVLRAVPDSRLLIKSRGLGDPGTLALVRKALAETGADLSRIEIRSHAKNFRDHLDTYNQVDIALDTFPYNGTTTTCEALWMGAPVVTLSGATHCSRVGQTLLAHVGFDQWVAKDAAQYVAIAGELAANLDELRHIRRTLRDRLSASSLCDAPAFTRRYEDALRQLVETP